MTRTDAAARDLERHAINRANQGRAQWRDGLKTVVILDEDNRTMDVPLQRFQQKLSHVESCSRLTSSRTQISSSQHLTNGPTLTSAIICVTRLFLRLDKPNARARSS